MNRVFKEFSLDLPNVKMINQVLIFKLKDLNQLSPLSTKIEMSYEINWLH